MLIHTFAFSICLISSLILKYLLVEFLIMKNDECLLFNQMAVMVQIVWVSVANLTTKSIELDDKYLGNEPYI